MLKPVILVACEKGQRSSPSLANFLRERLDEENLQATIYYAGVRHHDPVTDSYLGRLQGTHPESDSKAISANKMDVFVSASPPAAVHFHNLGREYLEENFFEAYKGIDTQKAFLDRIVAKVRQISEG